MFSVVGTIATLGSGPAYEILEPRAPISPRLAHHISAGEVEDVILQIGPPDYSVLAWVHDEGNEPAHRVVTDRIKAASTAAVLARKLQQRYTCPMPPSTDSSAPVM